jgi:hypothetical protein
MDPVAVFVTMAHKKVEFEILWQATKTFRERENRWICKNKYKDITRNIEGMYKKKPYEICKLLTAVIVENVMIVNGIP